MSGFVAGGAQDIFCGTGFDPNAAAIHDGDLICKVGGHRKVVGDEKIGETEGGLKLEQEIGDLRLDRAIECGERFIQDDELWLKRQGAGNREGAVFVRR